MGDRPKDRLSRMVWSILDDLPDTFVGDPQVSLSASDVLLIKAYVERLEIQAGFTNVPTIDEIRKSLLDEYGSD